MKRSQLAGAQALAQALAQGRPVRVVLAAQGAAQQHAGLLQAAQAAGARVQATSEADLRRMSAGEPAELLALLGPAPGATLQELLARGGACWLLHRASYPSNVGFAVRTAEVSGADGLIVDADFSRDQRSRVSHVSMGADRRLPLVWDSTDNALAEAKRQGVRCIAIEHGGDHSIYESDLTGPALVLVGNERHGIERDVLARCDLVAHIPMRGFVPSYNLQAALSMVAGERLRQVTGRPSQGNQSSTRAK